MNLIRIIISDLIKWVHKVFTGSSIISIIHLQKCSTWTNSASIEDNGRFIIDFSGNKIKLISISIYRESLWNLYCWNFRCNTRVTSQQFEMLLHDLPDRNSVIVEMGLKHNPRSEHQWTLGKFRSELWSLDPFPFWVALAYTTVGI